MQEGLNKTIQLFYLIEQNCFDKDNKDYKDNNNDIITKEDG